MFILELNSPSPKAHTHTQTHTRAEPYARAYVLSVHIRITNANIVSMCALCAYTIFGPNLFLSIFLLLLFAALLSSSLICLFDAHAASTPRVYWMRWPYVNKCGIDFLLNLTINYWDDCESLLRFFFLCLFSVE